MTISCVVMAAILILISKILIIVKVVKFNFFWPKTGVMDPSAPENVIIGLANTVIRIFALLSLVWVLNDTPQKTTIQN